MSPTVINNLKNEMKISWSHFEEKYFSFSSEVQILVDDRLQTMMDASTSIKAGDLSPSEFNDFYYEDGDDSLNEFLQAMFDCFKEWQKHDGIDLQKRIYEHTNRGTDNWFPVVIIDQIINECVLETDIITLYRGCDEYEYATQEFKQRQSWTIDLSQAKVFAFCHPSSKTSLEKRVVIRASVHKRDILWDRRAESEMVLKLGFSPESTAVVMTYGDYKA